jgi:hypothetical protein
MQTIKPILLANALSLLFVQSVYALEVDREVVPRMTIGGRVISTMDSLDSDSEPKAEDGINLSDSAILMRFDKRMYRDGVAGAVVGIKENDEAAVFHQLHVFYWNRNYRFELGVRGCGIPCWNFRSYVMTICWITPTSAMRRPMKSSTKSTVIPRHSIGIWIARFKV